MSLTMPDWFKAAAMEISLDRATVTHTSQTTKMTQMVDLYSWQWRISVQFPPCSIAGAGAREALVNRLAGGAETISLHHRYRPLPIGTMRGAPTLNANAAQFANSITIAGAWDTSRQNRFPYSQQLTSWLTAYSSVSVVDNVTVAPDGTTTAELIVDNWLDTAHFIYRTQSYGATGVKVLSAYVKSGPFAPLLELGGSAVSAWAWFNTKNGVATVGASTGTIGAATAGMESVGGGWWRCWIKANMPVPTGTQYVVMSDFTGDYSYKGWGRNLRTNSALYSQQFDNAAWTKVASGGGSVPVVTSNYATDPSGGSTADRIQFVRTTTAGNDNSLVIQYGMGVSQSARSIWMKSTGGATQYVLIYAAAGVYAEVAVTSTWRRFVVSAAVDEFRIGIHRTYGAAQPLSADILVWQAQNEAGAPTAGDTLLTTGTTASTTDYIYKTNLLPYCNSFENWSNSQAAVTSGHQSPFWSTDARKLVITSSNSTHYSAYGANPTDGTYTISVYAKAAELSWIRLQISAAAYAYFNTSTGAVGTSAGVTTSVEAAPNGYYRLAATGFTESVNCAPIIWLASADNLASFAGTAGHGVYVYGAQLQSGIAATPLIITTGAAVTETDAPGLAVWGLQLEDDVLTDYIPTTAAASYAPGTLKSGDMLGIGSQLLQVADDATANASGVMTVNLVNRLRTSATSGASIVWDKPTAEFYLADGKARSVYSPNMGGGQALEFVERVS